MTYPVSRRAAVSGALAASLTVSQTAAVKPAEAAMRRTATIDWAVLETLVALGAPPVAAPELKLYRSVVVEPAVPASVADIGLRGSPNYEALRSLWPDVIFSSNYYAWAEPKLRLIAPVNQVSIYEAGQQPYAAAEQATLHLGRESGTLAAANALIADAEHEIDRLRGELNGWDGRPLVVINLGDARHFRVFGTDSMFGEVLRRLGFANAWTEPTSYAATAPIGIEMLAWMSDAWIVIVPPVPLDAIHMLDSSAFWHALPSVRAGRVVMLDSVNPFGALPAARRFARSLSSKLRETSLG